MKSVRTRRFMRCAAALLAGMMILNTHAESRKFGRMWGANVDIAQLLPGDPLYLSTDRGGAFDVARLAAFNTLRVTSFAEWAPGQRGTSYSTGDWRRVGELAKRYDMTIIPVVGLSRVESDALAAEKDASRRAQKRLLAYQSKVRLILEGLTATGCKIVVDLQNEPELDADELAQLRALATFVHTKYPGVLVTVGGWKRKRDHPEPSQAAYVANYPDDGAPLVDIVDIVSVHVYDEALPDHRTYGLYARHSEEVPGAVAAYLGRVQQWAAGKPILISEFGAPNGVLPTRYRRSLGPIDPSVQRDTVDGVLQGVGTAASEGAEVVGALVWIMVPRGGPAALRDESNEWSLSLPDTAANTLKILPAMWAFCRSSIATSPNCPKEFPSALRLRTN
jgi:hypothetical protein